MQMDIYLTSSSGISAKSGGDDLSYFENEFNVRTYTTNKAQTIPVGLRNQS